MRGAVRVLLHRRANSLRLRQIALASDVGPDGHGRTVGLGAVDVLRVGALGRDGTGRHQRNAAKPQPSGRLVIPQSRRSEAV